MREREREGGENWLVVRRSARGGPATWVPEPRASLTVPRTISALATRERLGALFTPLGRKCLAGHFFQHGP